MPITQEQQEQYIAMRGQYHKTRDELKGRIAEHQRVIASERLAISDLEKAIKAARPRTEKGKLVCENCDMISMAYDGIIPGQGGRWHVYVCEICGKTYSQS